MNLASKFFRNPLVLAAIFLASAAVLGFSQSAPGVNPDHSSTSGVLVISVQNGSPAQKAGLARGDIILDINGKAVNSVRDARDAISSEKQGDAVSVEVRHGDQTKTLSVVLGQNDGRPYMGAMLLPAESESTGMAGPGRNSLPWALSEGALVEKVVSGGPAAKAGITKGDVILSVDGVKLTADKGLQTLIQDKKIGQMVTLSVVSNGQSLEGAPHDVKVTLGSTADKTKPWLGVEYRTGLPTAFLAPWGNLPPLAGIQMPDLGNSLPALPSMPDSGIPQASGPSV